MRLKKINIAPTKEEQKIIPPSAKLRVPCEFNSETAWELANLNRIAYRDYELYDDWFNGKNQITDFVNKGEVIYTPKEINQKRIDEYYIPVRDERVDPKSEYKDIIDPAQFNQYKILDTYDYLTYSFLVPEVVRFGFIAQKESNNGESPIIVVFRGTREAEEWFNNFQFKQLEFLSGISKKINKLENRTINLGFNKMYTDYRPGIFMPVKPLNILSKWLDRFARNISRIIFKKKHQQHTSSIYQVINKFFTKNQQYKENTTVYLTGHSLGGALATISALHIADQTEIAKEKIVLYSFASPRVGNQNFAKDCQSKFTTYRITNSEDLVPKIPFPVWSIIGVETPLTDAGNLIITILRNILNFVTSKIFSQAYQHIGEPIYFTHQAGAISSNHNMTITYCGALENIVHCCDRRSSTNQ